MNFKNSILSFILILLFACGGEDSNSSAVTELAIQDRGFINDMEDLLGYSLDLLSISENILETQGNKNYYRIQSLDLSGTPFQMSVTYRQDSSPRWIVKCVRIRETMNLPALFPSVGLHLV